MERMLYGHDIAAIPTLVKPFIGNTVPSAVVHPTNENELVDFYRMNKVISVDPLSMPATVQAAVMWEKLEKKSASRA